MKTISKLLIAMACSALLPAAINRPEEPIVLVGSSLSGISLLGILPGQLVAFRYVMGAWEQVPIQVDERDMKDYGACYSSPAGVSYLSYTDTGTFVGPDSDPTIDANDEIVFMAGDTGGIAPVGTTFPLGVVPGTGLQITIVDPLTMDTGYMYLFQQDGSLNSGAGRQYVAYSFSLLSGSYLGTYNRNSGPNRENSTVTTTAYAAHFSDRWLQDQMKIFLATGSQILDRFKFHGSGGGSGCFRTEDTFDGAEGCFVINKSGPVRAIRSFMGANSGTFTQRTHYFYAQMQQIVTDPRVHAGIHSASGYDFLNFNSSVSGQLSYFDSGHATSVLINGKSDAVSGPAPAWQAVLGPLGYLNSVNQGTSTVPPQLASQITTYYLDNTNAKDQCTGAKAAYGANGTTSSGGSSCTDPRPGICATPDTEQGIRSIFYGAASTSPSVAAVQNQRMNNPVSVTVASWQ